MKTYQRNENMEFGEQVLRGGVGLIMLETVLLGTAMSPALIAGLSLTALYMAFTALTGWDPVYALGRGGLHREIPQALTETYLPRREAEGSPKQKMAA